MDPIAALRPCAIDVELGEYTYTIPALPAAEWLQALLDSDQDGAAILPGLLNPPDRTSVWADYMRGFVTPDELMNAARDALEVAGGRRWWEVDRLVRSAATKDNWPLMSGKLTTQGVRLEEISLAQFINAVYSIAMEGCQEQADRDRLKYEVEAIPAGLPEEELEGLFDEEAETDDFFADVAELGSAPDESS